MPGREQTLHQMSNHLFSRALRVFHRVLRALESPASPACTHASLFVLKQHVPMNFGKQEALPIHPKQAFQAGLGTCQSVINLPFTVTAAFRRLASPGQVDPGDSLEPCWRVGMEKGEATTGLKAPNKPSPTPGWAGTRQSDTLAEPIWHTREQLTLLPIFHGAS